MANPFVDIRIGKREVTLRTESNEHTAMTFTSDVWATVTTGIPTLVVASFGDRNESANSLAISDSVPS